MKGPGAIRAIFCDLCHYNSAFKPLSACCGHTETTMCPSDPAGEHANLQDFLRERLDRGNDCLLAGNARGAVVYYDSALASFHASSKIPVLHDTYRALWTNKALAHQQLRELAKSHEAAMFANSLPLSG